MAEGIIRFDAGWRLDEGHHLDQPPVVPAPALWVPPKSKSKKATKTMDYLPTKRAELKAWWANIRDQITVEGPKMGLPMADVTAVQTLATDHAALMQATDDADLAAKGARAAEKAATGPNTAAIRNAVRYWKTRPLYGESGSEGVLGLSGADSDFDPNTFKPAVKLSIVGGQVKVDFTKGEADMVAIYGRQRGQVGWTKLGTDSSTPYYDTAPLAVGTTPENREYQVRAILDDVEIGVPSDIVSIVFGG